jgi:hypothetical protein
MTRRLCVASFATVLWIFGASTTSVMARPDQPRFTISCLVIDGGSLRDTGWEEQVGTDVWFITVEASEVGERVRECRAAGFGGEAKVHREP